MSKNRRSLGKCRDCGATRVVGRNDWHLAARPRCYNCGGMLDRVTGAACIVRVDRKPKRKKRRRVDGRAIAEARRLDAEFRAIVGPAQCLATLE